MLWLGVLFQSNNCYSFTEKKSHLLFASNSTRALIKQEQIGLKKNELNSVSSTIILVI